MIRLSFDGSDQRVITALRVRGPRILEGERVTMVRLMQELQKVVQRKLSGEVLKSHGGGLLGTVRQSSEQAGSQIVGVVQAGGGLFWWAIVHERGGLKPYLIEPGIVTGRSDKKALAFLGGGIGVGGQGSSGIRRLYYRLGERRSELRTNLKTGFSEFGAAGGIVVKKVIHPPAKQRSFMASSLAEMRAEIIRRVYETAAKALR